MALKIWSAGETLAAADLNNNFTEVGGSLTAVFPSPAYAAKHNTEATIYPSSNTTGYTGSFILPSSITINKISFYINTVTASGTVKLGIYSADGQTRYLNDTTSTISVASAAFTHTLSTATFLAQSQYYFVIVPVSTTNISLYGFERMDVGSLLNSITSEPKLYGTLTVTAGTLPTTFTPSSAITDSATGLLPTMRFDN
ncbi:MAG: hypothetical protein H0X02_09780 [Nitrosomonas sp.]|jgi:hypothetical protein|nr:hypothetical protein [Nitrosomonas sp.]